MGWQQKNALKSLANAANSGIWKSEDVPSSWVDWKCCANEANFGILKIWRFPSWDGKNARRARVRHHIWHFPKDGAIKTTWVRYEKELDLIIGAHCEGNEM